MKNIERITKKEIVVLVLMFLSYLAALYFLIINNRDFALIFFVLHAILIAAYYYISQDRGTRSLLELEEQAAESSEDGLKKKNEKIAMLQMELQQVEDENAEYIKKLSDITKESEQLADKISQMTLESTATQAQLGFLPEKESVTRCNLLSVINDVYEEFTPQCMKRGIRLDLQTSFKSVDMQCDVHYMKILFGNIIDNAMKYMNRKGSFIITLSDIGEEGIFMVCKDTGDGLPSSEAGDVFKLNYQGSNGKEGNGLGLVQAKAIVEHYGGKIYARCEQDEGMAIYIQFPVESKG